MDDFVGRLRKFCHEWAKMRHTGDDIHGLHNGEDRQAILRASDIIAAADRIAALEAALGEVRDLTVSQGLPITYQIHQIAITALVGDSQADAGDV